MNPVTPDTVRDFLGARFSPQLDAGGLTAADLTDDFDLLERGIIDSLGLIELVGALDEAFGLEVDFEDLDPEELTVVGPFCRYVAARCESNG